MYLNIPFSIARVPHSSQLSAPNPLSLEIEQISEDESSILRNEEGSSDCKDYNTGDELEQKGPIYPSSKISMI